MIRTEEIILNHCSQHESYDNSCVECSKNDIMHCEHRISELEVRILAAVTVEKITKIHDKIKGYRSVIEAHERFISLDTVKSDIKNIIMKIDAFDGLLVMGILCDQDIKSICDQAASALLEKYGVYWSHLVKEEK